MFFYLKSGKPRPREVASLAQIHTASPRWTWNVCPHLSFLQRAVLAPEKGGFCKFQEHAGQPFCPSLQPRSLLGYVCACDLQARPAGMEESQAAECRGVAGPMWGLDVGTCFSPARQAVASSSPPEPCLICQAQNGSLARDWRVGRQAGFQGKF